MRRPNHHDTPMADQTLQPPLLAPLPVFQELSPEVRAAALARLMERRPPGDDLWIFAYGSLMWDPCFEAIEERPATVHGYSRAFTMWSWRARGTVERPGLGLGLEDDGGRSVGLAYRFDPARETESLDAAWNREMVTGIYEAHWVSAETADGPVPAITFVIERSHHQYAGHKPVDEMAAIMAGAEGSKGPCRDYLANVVAELDKLEAPDAYLADLLIRVDANRANRAAIGS
jgi:cation transport protein ChaC